MLMLMQPPSTGGAVHTTPITSYFSSSSSTSSSSSSISLCSSFKLKPLITTRFPKLYPNNKSSRFSPIFAINKGTDKNGSLNSSTSSVTNQPSSSFNNDDTVFVGQDNVPLEGVIQFDKPSSSSRVQKWGRIALLAGGDVLALLMFAAIGRFSHGFRVLDPETLRTADPFIAGWFLSAYFLGGYSEDGRGMNGFSKAVAAATKSWVLGIPVGLGIRALTSGHLPPTNFAFVTLGSTAILLIGWRTLVFQILPRDRTKKDDMYRRGSPFELFELLTSLIRRW